jgi:hypothetical protein
LRVSIEPFPRNALSKFVTALTQEEDEISKKWASGVRFELWTS